MIESSFVEMASFGVTGMGSSLPMSLSGGETRHAHLSQVTQETELQKLLADEKMRSEQHKVNYQTLKAEHTRLQDEYVTVQSELKATIEESKLVQEKYTNLLDQARKDLAAKNADVESYKAKALEGQRLEIFKMKIQEDVEVPFRERFAGMEKEMEQYRNEYNKLKYEYSFLKSEYEHEKTEHERIVEEMKLRHEAEVTNLRKERESLGTRLQSDNAGDHQKVRALQRENAQCHLKIKNLLSELEEIRAQREHLGLQSDSVSRLQNKQLAEHQSNVKTLETEKNSLKLQCENLQKEVSNSAQLQTELTARIHDLEKENIVLKNRCDETEHKSKVDLTNLKMEMLKERGDLERQCDHMKNKIEDLKSQLEIQKHQMNGYVTQVADKEREAVKRVQAAREEEWQKLHTVENEKVNLETKLQEMERRKIDDEAEKHAFREKMEDKIRQASDSRDTAEKEALVLRTKVQHQESMLSQLERERVDNSDLKRRLHNIESTYQSYVSSEQELIEQNDRLKSKVENLQEDIRESRETVHRAKTDNENTLAQQRASWVEEKMNYQRRVDELDKELADMHSKLTDLVASHKGKMKKYTRVIHKLKNRCTLLEAQKEEMKVHMEALKRSIPAGVHQQIKKQLQDLMRRHREFRAIMLSSQVKEVNIGEMSFASGVMPFDISQIPNMSLIDPTGQYEKDLERVRKRIEMLDDCQRHQLEEIKGALPTADDIPEKLKHVPDFSDSDSISDKENLVTSDKENLVDPV